MGASRFTESQIIAAFRQVDSGRAVKDVCREFGVSNHTYYAWRAKYRGLDAPGLSRLRELEVEHGRLKRMYAELAMENQTLKALAVKKGQQ